jgi:hypothetical protein
MIRYKILGADGFDKTTAMQQKNINSDLGHFLIGTDEQLDIVFDDVPMPPKQLWIKARVDFSAVKDTPVIRQTGASFVWKSDESRCENVRIVPMQILYAQKDNLVTNNWQLQDSIFEHHFAVSATIYTEKPPETMVFWPCGGKVSANILEIEQLYAQAPNDDTDTKIYANSLSTCSKLIAKTNGNTKFLFHPPPVQKLSLTAALSQGLMVVKISDGDLEYAYKSVMAENPGNEPEFVQILCERED